MLTVANMTAAPNLSAPLVATPSRLKRVVCIAREQPSLLAASIGGLTLLAAWLLSRFTASESVQSGLVAVTYVLCGVFAVQRAIGPLRQFKIDIHVMMLVGAGLALWIGHPEEGALLLFLFALSGSLEVLATGRAEHAVHRLGEQFPTEALVERNGRRAMLPLAAIAIGDRLIVRPGDRVACDGEILEGASHVDESAITGEFLPRSRSIGEPVYAGSLNGEQTLIVDVRSAAAQSTLARVAELVESARAQRTRVESLIDHVGRLYGPVVLGGAVLMMLAARFFYGEIWSAAIYRAIALLIVASPCALILATPVPILGAIAKAARHGIVAKGGVYFERLASARVLFVDKTGTLTTGKVRLVDVIMLEGADAGRAIAEAAGLEHDSTHPLAAAVMHAAHDRGISPATFSDVRTHPGRGIGGRLDGREVRLGRPDWALETTPAELRGRAIALVEKLAEQGKTPVVLSSCDFTSVLVFEDTVRPGVEQLSASLHEQGVTRIELLTGDRRGVADAIVETARLDACHAELLPAEKLEFIRKAVADGHGVVMIGDGVNDAPALARADVGIAMGGIGSHTALESADFVLLHDRIELLPELFALARKTRRIILQNVILALGVIAVLGVWVALTAHPVLSFSVIGHEGSTLLVVANGLRVLAQRGRWNANPLPQSAPLA